MTKPKTEVKKNSTALVKRTDELLDSYPEEKFNRLLPTKTLLDNLGNFQEPKVEILQFDPDDKVGDVYIDFRLGKGKRLFTKNSLDKIAYAGGLSWYPPGCVTEARDKGYVRCRATAVVKKANGEPLMITRTKEIDLEVEEEKIRENYKRKVEKNEVRANEVDALVRRDLLQIRENMLQLCESKACNRVIRAAFGLKSSYTVDEIEKPFLMIRFDTTYDLSDPNVLKLLAGSAQSAAGMLFPQSTNPAVQLAAPAEAEVEGGKTKDDLDDLLDGQPEEESVGMTPEQEAELAREARIAEIEGGCDHDQLKEIFIKQFQEHGYSRENDPNGYVNRWKLGNSKADDQKKRIHAEIIVDLEAEGGDPS